MKSRNLILTLMFVLSVAVTCTAADDHGHAHNDQHDEEHEEGKINLSDESQKFGKIKTVSLKVEALTQRIMVIGKVSQDPEKTEYITPEGNAVIKSCSVGLGAYVKQDEELCVIQTSDAREINLRAPFEGVLIAQLAHPGDKVSSIKPVFALADLNMVGVNFDVYEKDAHLVKLGQEVRIHTQGQPDKTYKGKIVFISPRMDETSNTLRIKAIVDNESLSLKLGMNVRGEVLVKSGDVQYLTVPIEAIQTVEGKSVVFVKEGADAFEAKEIKIINQTHESAAIEGDIHPEEQVVIEGSFILKSKMLESEMGHDHSH